MTGFAYMPVTQCNLISTCCDDILWIHVCYQNWWYRKLEIKYFWCGKLYLPKCRTWFIQSIQVNRSHFQTDTSPITNTRLLPALTNLGCMFYTVVHSGLVIPDSKVHGANMGMPNNYINLCHYSFGLWLAFCSAQSHYLSQCWLIINWTLGANCNEIWKQNLSIKYFLKMFSSAKCPSFCSMY